MDEKLKKAIELAREQKPEEFEIITADETDHSIPDGHTHAVVEVIDESDGYVYTKLLTTGDAKGIEWAYKFLQENYETDNTIHIVDLAQMQAVAEKIDFH